MCTSSPFHTFLHIPSPNWVMVVLGEWINLLDLLAIGGGRGKGFSIRVRHHSLVYPMRHRMISSVLAIALVLRMFALICLLQKAGAAPKFQYIRNIESQMEWMMDSSHLEISYSCNMTMSHDLIQHKEPSNLGQIMSYKQSIHVFHGIVSV